MNNARMLSASFLLLPFLILGSCWVPSDILTLAIEILIVVGLLSGILLAALFIVSTFLGALGGGIRRR